MSFMSEGSKACFLCSKQLEGQVTTSLVSPSCRASHIAMSLGFNYAIEVKKDEDI